MLAPAEEWQPSGHGWVLMQVHKGQAYWLGDSGAMDFVCGSLLVLPPRAQGVVRASQMGSTELVHFCFDPEMLSSILTLSERQFLDVLTVRPEGFPTMLPPEQPASQRMREIVELKVPAQGWLGRVYLIEVVALALESRVNGDTRKRDGMMHCHNRIRVMMNRLTEEELCAVPPSQLAANCGCSPQYFSRLFQKFFGVSLRARQADYRLRRARRMLAETETPMFEVARAAGCRHLSYFNTVFKKAFGITPTQYRRQQSKSHRSHSMG